MILILGIFLGWLFFHAPQSGNEKHDHVAEALKSKIWTCAMHPQIRMDKPGKCPICAMDLIPLNLNNGIGQDAGALHMSKEAVQLANVMTSVVSARNPVKRCVSTARCRLMSGYCKTR